MGGVDSVVKRQMTRVKNLEWGGISEGNADIENKK